jgi:hypothetical protein
MKWDVTFTVEVDEPTAVQAIDEVEVHLPASIRKAVRQVSARRSGEHLEQFRELHEPVRTAEVEDLPDTTRTATVRDYVGWLRKWTAAGGKITHSYDYPFQRAGFRYSGCDVTIDSDNEYRANSRSIILGTAAQARRTNPKGPFGGYAHTKVYFADGTLGGGTGPHVPVFSDPEFDEFRS